MASWEMLVDLTGRRVKLSRVNSSEINRQSLENQTEKEAIFAYVISDWKISRALFPSDTFHLNSVTFWFNWL